MNSVDVFSARDLRINASELLKDAENGQLSLITKHGRPTILAIPFNQKLLNLGVDKELALVLFEKRVVSLSKAAKIAGVSMEDFLRLLSDSKIDVVDYPEDDLDKEMELHI